jgi:SAM-dependent methyltransferase
MNTAHLAQAETEIDMAYDALEGAEDLIRYHRIHGTPSLLVLTQYSPDIAKKTASFLIDDIKDKIVIEIGAGVGFLAIELARYAKQVFAIEVDPAWSWIFTHSLYDHKPPNLTWIFGKAETVLHYIHGDIAIVVTHSGETELKNIAYKFAPKVIIPFTREH